MIGPWGPAERGPEGVRLLSVDDRDQGVFAWLRFGAPEDPPALVVSNFTPVPREAYRVGVPRGGSWREVINTDASIYGGANMGNGGAVRAEEIDTVVAARPSGPIHIHVAEQMKEVEASLAWSGRRPVDWLLDHVALDELWTLVHATQMTDA